ncbi:hypothetical protein OROGR_000402 [Orobanche gracilis]
MTTINLQTLYPLKFGSNCFLSISMAPKCHLQHVTKGYPFMTCVMKVHAGSFWQNTVRKVLNKCHGVYSFRMDENGMVEISGTVNPAFILKMLEKAGNKAKLHWFQFGECSSNLFMPINQDGRFLQAGNLSRPNPPSQQKVIGSSSATNPNHGYQFPYYNQRHDYDRRAYHPNHHYQHYYRSHEHDYQYNYGQMHDGKKQIHYRQTGADGDMGCCRMM